MDLESRLIKGFQSVYNGEDMIGDNGYGTKEFRPDAIIAISEHGIPSMVRVLTRKHWLLESIKQYDDLADHEFPDMIEGLYYAQATCFGDGEDSETSWLPTKAIYVIEKGIDYE